MIKSLVVIPKVWRSELRGVVLFFLFCILSVVLSRYFPGSVITGKLFEVGSTTVSMSLPLWWFLPFVTLVTTMVKIYNVRYTVDAWGCHCKVGILSLRMRSTSVRYEDIRSIETDQTLLERILDVGSVLISTASTSGVEVLFSGVAAPIEVQEMLQRERESRQKTVKPAPDRIEERLSA